MSEITEYAQEFQDAVAARITNVPSYGVLPHFESQDAAETDASKVVYLGCGSEQERIWFMHIG